MLPMLPMVTTQWFIALFVLWLPTEALLRLWDCFLADGLKSKKCARARDGRTDAVPVA